MPCDSSVASINTVDTGREKQGAQSYSSKMNSKCQLMEDGCRKVNLLGRLNFADVSYELKMLLVL